MKLSFIGLIVLLVGVKFANAQVPNTCFKSYTMPSSNILSSNSGFLVHADFNNDGYEDVITSGYYLFKGTASGNYSTPVQVSVISSAGMLLSMTTADFNGDGNIDIATGSDNIGGNNNIRIYLGTGLGTFGYASTFASSCANDMLAGDFNADGKIDLVIAGVVGHNTVMNELSVVLGNGNGYFGASQTYTTGANGGYESVKLISADFNQDSKPDLAVTNYSNDISVFLHASSGSLFLPAVNYPSGSLPRDLEIADLNSDGVKDIVIASIPNSATNGESFGVLYGSASGTFLPITTYTSTIQNTSNVVRVIVGDFNGDTKEDIVSFHSSNGSAPYINSYFNIHFGTGTGSFYGEKQYNDIKNYFPRRAFKSDPNNDSKLDLVVLGSNQNNESSLFNIRGIGNGDFVLGNSIPNPDFIFSQVLSEDINGDGDVDIVTLDAYATQIPGYPATVSYSVSVRANNGSGSFSVTNSYPDVLVGSSLFINDYNGDGKKDIATFQGTSTRVFFGNGDDTFTPQPVSSFTPCGGFGNSYSGVHSNSDFNEDGIGDIVALSNIGSGSYSLYILLGDVTGHFTASCTGINVTDYKILASDFNNDGHVDILNYNNAANFKVHLGTGSATFSSTVTTSFNTTYMEYLKSSDFNNDGKKDLLFYNSLSTTTFTTMLGDGNGGFTAATTHPLPYTMQQYNSSQNIDDYNADGNMDIAFAVTNPKRVVVMLGTGVATFTPDILPYNTINSGAGTGLLIGSGDYNSDGLVDIYTLTSDVFSFLFNGISNITLTSADGICQGNTVIISASGAPTYSWNTGATASSISVTPSVTTVYSVTSTPVFSGCANIAAKNLLVSPTPTLTTLSNPITACANSFLALSISGALTYSWSTGATTQTINIAQASASVYTVTGYNTSACFASKTLSVQVNPIPTITVNSGSICSGQTFTLNPAGANSYTFSAGSAVVSPTINSTYTITAVNSNTCTATAVSSVSVNALPNITVNSGSVCPGRTFTLVPSGAITYSYSSGSNTVTPVVNSTYTITGTGANGCVNSIGVVSSVGISTVVPTISVNDGTICSGQTFTMFPSGATTYSYSSGSNTVSPSVNSTYTITGADLNGCVNLVGAISTVSVNAAPMVTAQNASVCVGTSTVLNVSGANSYSWTTGATTSSISIYPTITTTYSVTGTDLNNCSSTQTLVVTVNPNCQDVWPGDANSDGVADNFDVLELGLHFTQTGPARATTSNTWQSWFANNWTGTITNGKNANHSDCNGDGTIDSNDTLAIFTNYSLTHAFKPTEPTAINPQLNIVPDQNAVAKGSWGTSSVFLGEASAPVTNINGLAFTITFDQNLVDANNFYIEYPSSFINTGNQNLKFSKPDFANGKLYTATTHTMTNNVSGNGKIAVLHYKVKSNLSTDEVLNIEITQAKQSNAAGTLAPLTAGAATIAAIGASVGMDELSNGNSVGMYPNPANSSVTIQSNTKLEKVELLSITGQIMLSEKGSGTHYQLDLANIANGVYMVHFYSADQKVTRKKLVVQR